MQSGIPGPLTMDKIRVLFSQIDQALRAFPEDATETAWARWNLGVHYNLVRLSLLHTQTTYTPMFSTDIPFTGTWPPGSYHQRKHQHHIPACATSPS